MPKVIENVRGRAIEEARKVLLEEGYEMLTVRRIARDLGIGIGTVYNYFPSKEFLTASVMLEDWQGMLGNFEKMAEEKSPKTLVKNLFNAVRGFCERYIPAWKEYENHGSSRAMTQQYHHTLSEQLSKIIQTALPAEQVEEEPYLAGFLAETVLRCGSDISCEWSAIEPAVQKLLKRI